MKKIFFISLLILLAFFMQYCSENNNNPVTSETSDNNTFSQNISDDYSVDIRLEDSGKLNKTATAMDIDPSAYAIHFFDYYNDTFYMNKVNETNQYVYYRGMWHSNSAHGDFLFTLMYFKSTGSIAAIVEYRNNSVMLYHLNELSGSYYVGKFSSHRYVKNYVVNSIQPMWITLTKGSF